MRTTSSRGVLLACLLLALCRCAWGLDAGLDVSQYAHTAWKVRDGFTKGTINAITQTPDGYLLLGTEFGLLRFDGVKAVPWEPAGDPLPSKNITSLLTSRDGTLWIGTKKGLASWKDGKLTRYPALGEQKGIPALLEDHEGTVWVSQNAFPPPSRLCAIQKGSVQCYGEDGAFGYGAFGLFEDSKGALWAGVPNGLWRWKPGPPRFYSLPDTHTIRALGEDVDGTLLVGWKGKIWRLVDGKTEAYQPQRGFQAFTTMKLLRDRDGGLWIATLDRGLIHVHGERTDVFAQPDGLSGNASFAVFEDREGSIWTASYDGLDRFRGFAAATFGEKQGLSAPFVTSVLADRDGSVWMVGSGLHRWKNGEFSTYDKRDGKVTGAFPMALFQDAGGKIWVSTHEKPGGAGYFENDQFVLSGIRAKSIYSFAEDKGGNLWMADQDTGLFRLSRENEIQQTPWAKLGHKDDAIALAADPAQDGLWLGFFQGGLIYYADGKIQKSYAAADGLGGGRINQLRFGSRGTLWAATDSGLSRIRDGRILTLTSKNGLPCDAVHWSIEDNDHFVWAFQPCGLTRIERSELDAWVSDPGRKVKLAIFDNADGVRGRPMAGTVNPLVTKSTDGKLWFTGYDGVAVVDPKHLPYNKVPPPVQIEQIVADRKTYEVPAGAMGQSAMGQDALPDGRATVGASGSVPLPALLRELEIDYTALSLVAPEKIRFRIKLEGWDRDWHEVGNRRQAFYTGLGPKRYRFRVMASNNSGVWNEAGTFLDFSIAPAYYQTIWFRALCVAAFLALLWGLYRMRVHRIERHFEVALDATVRERTRIARELHDTLLQSFHGLMFQFQAARNMLPRSPEDATQALDRAIETTEHALAESRDAIRDLRPASAEQRDLAGLLTATGQELAPPGNGHSPVYRVIVEGEPQTLTSILQYEVYRIAREVIRNAFRHAVASRIEVEIRYDAERLRLRIRDDGKGIEENVLQGKGPAGHWGISGIRERATKIGSRLEFWSEVGMGTEVELKVPAAIAYEKGQNGRRFRLFRKAGSYERHV